MLLMLAFRRVDYAGLSIPSYIALDSNWWLFIFDYGEFNFMLQKEYLISLKSQDHALKLHHVSYRGFSPIRAA